MGIKYLWDTNTAIYYLQQQFPGPAEKFIDNLLNEWRPCISAITEIELLCWKTAKKGDLEVIQNFIGDAVVIELEGAIKQKTVEIRRSGSMKLPDAIIAATAITYDLILLTRNTRDFKDLEALLIVNPWEVA